MKKTIQIFSILLCLAVSTNLVAQDFLNVNDFNFNEVNYNVAFIAADSAKLDVSTVISIGRSVENNTKFHFLVEGTLPKLGLGIGAKVNTSFFGIYQATTAEFLIAKKISFSKNHSLRFGLNTGMVLNSLRESQINEYTNIDDPVLTQGQYNKVGFTAGLGLNYNWNNKLDIGVSLPVLVNSLRGLEPVYYASASYVAKLNESFDLKPGLILYGPTYTSPTLYGDLKFSYKKFLWIKAGMNTNLSTTFGAGGNVKFMSIGYVYNHNLLNDFSEIYRSAHHIHVVFHFLKTNKKKG